jgi:ATP-binding cassette, subfamily C, bacterial LapB
MVDAESLSNAAPLNKRSRMGSIFPWRRWDIICASLIINIISLVIPLTIIQIYDRIIPNFSYDTLAMLTFGMITAIVFEGILRFSRANILNWLGMLFDYVTSVGVFSHLLHAPLYQSNKIGIGKQIEDLESVAILKEFLAGQGFLTLLDIPFIIIFLGIIAYLSPVIAVVPVVIIILFVISGVYLSISQQKALSKRQDIDDRRYSFIIQILSNHYTLKTLGMEDLILRRYERIHAQCSVIENTINYTSAASRNLANITTYALFGGIVCIGAYEVINGHVSLGVLAASIILANRVMQPLQALMVTWVRFQHLTQAKQRFRQIFALDQEAKNYTQAILRGKVHLNNVSFSYITPQKTILDRVNLTIEPGHIISIQGSNGTGKTTIANLLIGHLQPTEGEILIDGAPLDSFVGPGFRHQVCLVSAKNLLFHGSIMDNLTTFQKGPIEEEAKKLSHYFGLDQWINHLPKGYHTMVADQLFLHLPEGIQQRICIIRALLNHPKILILDEANTSLDFQGDELLNRYLSEIKGQTTVIYITHRPSVEAIADQSYQLIQGKLEPKQLPPKTPNPTVPLKNKNKEKDTHV